MIANRATEYEASPQELLIKSDEPALPPIQPSGIIYMGIMLVLDVFKNGISDGTGGM